MRVPLEEITDPGPVQRSEDKVLGAADNQPVHSHRLLPGNLFGGSENPKASIAMRWQGTWRYPARVDANGESRRQRHDPVRDHRIGRRLDRHWKVAGEEGCVVMAVEQDIPRAVAEEAKQPEKTRDAYRLRILGICFAQEMSSSTSCAIDISRSAGGSSGAARTTVPPLP
ncbi:hypothetical protein ACFSLT_29140 [Novosphingobium resinovorum]